MNEKKAAAIAAAIRKMYQVRRPLPAELIVDVNQQRTQHCIVCGAVLVYSDEVSRAEVRRFRAEHNAECGDALLRQVTDEVS